MTIELDRGKGREKTTATKCLPPNCSAAGGLGSEPPNVHEELHPNARMGTDDTGNEEHDEDGLQPQADGNKA